MPLKFPFILWTETSSAKRPCHLSGFLLFKGLNFNANLITPSIRAGRCCADPSSWATCQRRPATPLLPSHSSSSSSRGGLRLSSYPGAGPRENGDRWTHTHSPQTPIPRGPLSSFHSSTSVNPFPTHPQDTALGKASLILMPSSAI